MNQDYVTNEASLVGCFFILRNDVKMKQTKPFYKSKEWTKCRRIALLRDNYLCQECLKEDILTPANTVHHIIPLEEAPDKALDLDNLLSICPPCHNKLHPEKGGGEREERIIRARVIESKPNREII